MSSRITLRRVPTRLHPDPETVVGILVSAPKTGMPYWVIREGGLAGMRNRVLDVRYWEKADE